MLSVKHKKNSGQHGFSLMELMVALVLSAFVTVSLLNIYNTFSLHSRKQLDAGRLYQQLEAAMHMMSSDIRRTGYWASASNDVSAGTNSNPFMASATDLSINGSNNCILISYDTNSDGALPTINSGSDDERYGYRLSGNAVQARPATAAFDCAATANAWENITDPNIITVTNLTFTATNKTISIPGSSASLRLRYIDITLTGRLANDSAITMTLNQHIRLRNDKFVP